MKNVFKKVVCILVVLGFFILPQKSLAQTPPPETFWKYQCIDTMKFSRDTARAWVRKDAQLNKLIEQQMTLIKNTGANCVALGTPYDQEFWPFMTKWVQGARKAGLFVWFRGNMSGWEGWFNYPKLKNTTEHHTGIYKFITQNKDLFSDKDIFTPAPEAENGLLGNPFASKSNAQNLRSFLAASYPNCKKAFLEIKKATSCGFFSTNGDVAKDILSKQNWESIGGVVTVDHFVKTAERFNNDIVYLNTKFNLPVFMGEFGAPIPDIHGKLTQAQQAAIVGEMLNKLYQQKAIVVGVNYWVLSDGSTALVNPDGTVREAYKTLKNYYSPGKITGTVYNDAGDRLKNVKVSHDTNHSVMTDDQGNFSLLVPANQNFTVGAELSNYSGRANSILLNSSDSKQMNFVLERENPSIFYKIKRFYRRLMD